MIVLIFGVISSPSLPSPRVTPALRVIRFCKLQKQPLHQFLTHKRIPVFVLRAVFLRLHPSFSSSSNEYTFPKLSIGIRCFLLGKAKFGLLFICRGGRIFQSSTQDTDFPMLSTHKIEFIVSFIVSAMIPLRFHQYHFRNNTKNCTDELGH